MEMILWTWTKQLNSCVYLYQILKSSSEWWANEPIDFKGPRSKVKAIIDKYGNTLYVMNSEISSSFGSHLAHIISVAHDERSNRRMLVVLFKIEGQGHGQMST